MANPLTKYMPTITKEEKPKDSPLSKYIPKEENRLEKYMPKENPLAKYIPQEKPSILQTYLKEAQPAFKLAVARPETFMGAEVSAEEIEKISNSSWTQLLQEAYPEQATTWGGQIRTGLGGGLLDIGTRPSSYIAAYGIEKGGSLLLNKVATSPAGRAFLSRYFPTFARGLLAKTKVTPKVTPKVIPKTQVPIETGPKPTLYGPRGEVISGQPKPGMVGSLQTQKFPTEARPPIIKAAPIKAPVRPLAQQRSTAELLKDKIDFTTLSSQNIVNAETRRAAALKLIDNMKKAVKSNNLKEMQEVYKQIEKLNQVHNEAGRLLGSLRDPLFEADDAMVKTLRTEMEKVIPESKEALAKFFKQASTPQVWDKFMELRTSSLLTSGYTHERNIIGNIIGRSSKIPERFFTGGADAVRRFITKQPRERYATEAVADIVGGGRGIRLGIKNAFRALLDEDFVTASRTREALRFSKSIPGPIGKLIRMPFRFLNAMDEFFSTWSHTSDLYSQAYRQAVKEGAPNLINRATELIKNPTLAMSANARREALYQTFRQPLGPAGKNFQQFLIKSKVGKFFMPFLRTPVNLFKWVYDRSPAAMIKLAKPSFYKLPVGQRMDEIGKMAFGQLMTAGIAWQSWEGNVTGRLSNNASKRKAMMRQGIMPYSVKIGDKWISYRGYEPVSTWLGFVANTIEQSKEIDKEPSSKQVGAVLTETVKLIRDNQFMMGIRDLFRAMDEPDRYGPTFIQRLTAGTVIPTGVSYVARLLDPTMREPEGIKEAIKARLPLLSKQVTPRLDVWGRPITREGKLMERAFNPSGVVTEKPDLTEQELLSLEKFPSKITKKYRGIPLSVDERNLVTRVEGSIIKNYLDRIIRLPEYRKLDKYDREQYIDTIIKKIRTEVRRAFLPPKIIKDLKGFKNREEKILYIENLLKQRIIKKEQLGGQ